MKMHYNYNYYEGNKAATRWSMLHGMLLSLSFVMVIINTLIIEKIIGTYDYIFVELIAGTVIHILVLIFTKKMEERAISKKLSSNEER